MFIFFIGKLIIKISMISFNYITQLLNNNRCACACERERERGGVCVVYGVHVREREKEVVCV